ncbi:hypothetical protein OBBRIDRAFT_794379 [Obba rivulosa]|uniref:DUF6534 domain-containing protein n=1 Tax=Obba rivulosa TaxID=1052685 RepID=A0A8E2AUA3_9APHY|nr:hypothetical protein OBBRIDRAFT_794379 [Obba rivulosa]
MGTSLNDTLGAVELGILISTMLYGMSTIQVFSYLEIGKRDSRWLKLFVASIWILETIHTALIWVFLHSLTVSNYGDETVLSKIEPTFAASVVIHDFVGAAVQSFYAYRVYALSHNIIFSIIQWLGSLLRIALILTLLAFAVQSPSLEDLVSAHKGVTIAIVTTSAAVDVLNTTMLCYNLTTYRRNGTKQTTRTIDKIILWSVETGLITSLVAIAILIVMLALPQATIWEGLMMIYAKLYSNSLLVSLNARGSLRQIANATGTVGISTIKIAYEQPPSRSNAVRPSLSSTNHNDICSQQYEQAKPIAVHVDTKFSTVTDVGDSRC